MNWVKKGKIFSPNSNYDWMHHYAAQVSAIELDDFIKELRDNKVLHRRSGDHKVLHKGLDISGASKRCLWIDNSTFDDIMTNNLPLDIPRRVN